MKKFLAIITGLVSILAMTSCSNMSEQDIEKEIASGVVLVQNQSYYEVDLSNGAKIFFSNFDAKEGLNDQPAHRRPSDVFHSSPSWQ